MIDFLVQLGKRVENWASKNNVKSITWLLPILLSLYIVVGLITGSWSRDTALHPFYLVTAGVILIVAGIMELRRRLLFHPRWPGWVLLALGATFVLIGVKRWYVPPLPEDRLVLVVARFTPETRAAEEAAGNVSARLVRRLREKAVPITVKYYRLELQGTTDEERLEYARNLTRPHALNAHAVLWGEVRVDGPEAFITPRLDVPRAPSGLRMRSRDLRRFYAADYSNVTSYRFHELAARELTEIITFMWGLAYYEASQYEEAIAILEKVMLRDADFLIGMSYRRLADTASNPTNKLVAAFEHFSQAAAKDTSRTLKDAEQVVTASLNNLAATAGRLQMYLPIDSARHLAKQGVRALEQAGKAYLARGDSVSWATTVQLNLASLLGGLADQAPLEERTRLRGRAAFELRTALTALEGTELSAEKASLYGMLGVMLGDLSSDRDSLWRQAVSAFDTALNLQSTTGASVSKAFTLHNYALVLKLPVLQDLEETGEFDESEMLRAATMLREVTETEGVPPFRQALAFNALGSTLGELGLQAVGGASIGFLREAADAFERAKTTEERWGIQKVCPGNEHWLSITYRELAKRVGRDTEATTLLEKARIAETQHSLVCEEERAENQGEVRLRE